MKILVLAEINDGELAEDQTSKTVSAATSLGKVMYYVPLTVAQMPRKK